MFKHFRCMLGLDILLVYATHRERQRQRCRLASRLVLNSCCRSCCLQHVEKNSTALDAIVSFHDCKRVGAVPAHLLAELLSLSLSLSALSLSLLIPAEFDLFGASAYVFSTEFLKRPGIFVLAEHRTPQAASSNRSSKNYRRRDQGHFIRRALGSDPPDPPLLNQNIPATLHLVRQ